MTDKYLEARVQETRTIIDKVEVPEIKNDFIVVLNNLRYCASHPDAYDGKEALEAIQSLKNIARSYNIILKSDKKR